MPPKAMMTIKSPTGRPSVADAASILRVEVSAIDETFGVILLDPDHGLYAVQVDADALATAEPHDARVEGPFANPRIEPFDP